MALVVARLLRRLARPAADAATPAQANPWAPARTLGWILATIVFAAAVLGYIAFANFLINQAIVLAILACGLFLADVVVQDGPRPCSIPTCRSADGSSAWSACAEACSRRLSW